MTGQIIAAFGQGFLDASSTKLAAHWFGEKVPQNIFFSLLIRITHLIQFGMISSNTTSEFVCVNSIRIVRKSLLKTVQGTRNRSGNPYLWDYNSN